MFNISNDSFFITYSVIMILLIALSIIIPLIIITFIIKKLKKAKSNYYISQENKKTELELLREQNELLKQIANNKGE